MVGGDGEVGVGVFRKSAGSVNRGLRRLLRSAAAIRCRVSKVYKSQRRVSSLTPDPHWVLDLSERKGGGIVRVTFS